MHLRVSIYRCMYVHLNLLVEVSKFQPGVYGKLEC